jgi:DNA-binding NarL/FixJ family response regulator
MSGRMQSAIRLAVSSEDRMLCEVLELSLAGRDGVEVVCAAAEENGAVDVVLVDAGLGPAVALARLGEAGERWPEAKAVAFGVEREDESVVELIEAGAGGYVLRGASLDDLVAAVRAAHQGLAACSPRVVALVLARISELSRCGDPAPVIPEVEPLTLREREILGLLAAGLANKEVGQRLRITVQTVKNHVHRILEKLGVHRRRDAVRRAYDLGILAEPGEIPPAGWSLAAEEGEGSVVNPF